MSDLLPSASIVVLTGAGVSRESGLDTFRDPDGIWRRHRIEDVATPEGYRRDPDLVHAFYNARRRALLDPALAPNPAHVALADLDRRWPGDLLLVTQNVDDLHERAGSRRLVHMHGELLKVRCERSRRVFEWRADLSTRVACACCGVAATLRPHVVWFGEVPLRLEEIFEALRRCGLFVAIGTSGQVHPAAGFVQEARGAGARTILLNLEAPENAASFDEIVLGPASETVPALVAAILDAPAGGA